MASIIGIEYIASAKGAPNGLAGLDNSGLLTTTILPTKIPDTNLNIPSGNTLASLDSTGHLPTTSLPATIPADNLPTIPDAKLNIPSGNTLASLDSTGHLPTTSLPTIPVDNLPTIPASKLDSSIRSPFRGEFTSGMDLPDASDSALGDYAFVADEATVGSEEYGLWYFNPYLKPGGIVTPGWIKQKITTEAYNDLDPKAQGCVPFIITTL